MRATRARFCGRTGGAAAAVCRTAAITAGMLAATAVMVLATTATVTLGAPAPRAAEAAYAPPQGADFSHLSWLRAFDALHGKISREYAFTQWKGIDWESLYAEYLPRVLAAQDAGDLGAYYLALKRYALELRDGHVAVGATTAEAQRAIAALTAQRTAGGFGLVATRLDDGRLIASWVKPGGPAAKAGVQTGAELVAWGGKPAAAALANTSTALAPAMPTDWRVAHERSRFLVRAPVGAVRAVVFRNPGRSALARARVTAADDGGETLRLTDARSVLGRGEWPERVVEPRLLGNGIGYVRIAFELDLPAELPGDHTPTLTLFRQAVDGFIAAGVRGIILDIRGNAGGYDSMPPVFMAAFYDRRSLYEYQSYIDPQTGLFHIWLSDDATGEFTQPGEGLWIEPGDRRFAGPVVALVDNGCISSGEGIAMAVKRLPQGKVVGIAGTNGSFGITGDWALMPGGLGVNWPYGRSLDARKVVQIDARHGRGGVTPDVRVPMTARNAVHLYRGDDVVLEYGLKTLRGMMQ
jgi:carboxyl-terminal processing protease